MGLRNREDMDTECLIDFIRPSIKGGTVDKETAWSILQKLNIPISYGHFESIFKGVEQIPKSTNKKGFQSIYETLVYRKEFQDIFKIHSKDGEYLSPSELLQFLQKEQFEENACSETAHALIKKYQTVKKDSKEGHLNMEGFTRLMTSPEMQIFKQIDTEVHENMNLPLNNYFISSSHNTYLTSDQLIGKSQLIAYASALLAGCRCVEIDTWDGPGNEPVVTHGGTLTSKILFKDVLIMIKTCAFVKSQYPVILSLENHCSSIQKDVMANDLKQIFGDLLLTSPLHEEEDSLPSPEELKNKILIKGRIYYKDSADSCSSPSEDSEEEDNLDDDEDNMNDKKTTERKRKLVKQKAKTFSRMMSIVSKRSKVVLSDEMMKISEYVIYLKPGKFRSLEQSEATQQFDECTSVSEVIAKKLADNSAPEFISHTRKFLARIYPKGTRVGSSNYNPQTFWNVGCQMVCLNFQTDGLAMDLQRGKFKSNGNCGYLLKPESLRDPDAQFNPIAPAYDFDPYILSIMIICGNQLLLSDEAVVGDKLNPFVTVEVHGIHLDEAKQQTTVIKNNAFNPEWNQPLNFTIHAPELALVRFGVESQKTISSSDFVGQHTLALTSMNKGYRTVPLLKKNGDPLRNSTLFVHVQYGYRNAVLS